MIHYNHFHPLMQPYSQLRLLKLNDLFDIDLLLLRILRLDPNSGPDQNICKHLLYHLNSSHYQNNFRKESQQPSRLRHRKVKYLFQRNENIDLQEHHNILFVLLESILRQHNVIYEPCHHTYLSR